MRPSILLALSGAIALSACGSSGGGGSPAATAITSQPAPTTVPPGANATFTVVATGANLRYQWRASLDGGASWTDVAGATAASAVVPSATLAMSGDLYEVVVTGDNGTVTSQSARLTVAAAAAPTITQQPADASVVAPAAATFQVVATGSPSPSFQWQISTDGGATFSDVAGATGASYTTAPTALADSGHRFRVVATNSEGSVTSSAASLTVTQGQGTSAALCAPQALAPGTRIEMTLGSSANPAYLETFIGTANGAKVFHGVSAPEVEAQVSDNLTGISIDAKAYASVDSATGVVTNFGTLSTTTTNLFGHTTVSAADGVYSPVFLDRRYTLGVGQTMTQTWTQDETITVTVDGTVNAPTSATVSQTETTTYAGTEQITVPAGTFSACKFVETFQGAQGTSQTTHWLLLHYGVDIQSTTNGITVSAKTILVNGAPL